MSLPAVSKHLKVLEARRSDQNAAARRSGDLAGSPRVSSRMPPIGWNTYRHFWEEKPRSLGRFTSASWKRRSTDMDARTSTAARGRRARARHHPASSMRRGISYSKRGPSLIGWRDGGGRKASRPFYHDMDIRPGGAFRVCMRSPRGCRALEARRLPRGGRAGARGFFLRLPGRMPTANPVTKPW